MLKRLSVIVCLLSAPVFSFADTCDYQREINFIIDAENAQSLTVDVGAGSLEIRGDSNSRDVVVNATACAGSKSQFDALDLVYERNGTKEVLSIKPISSRYYNIFHTNNVVSTLRTCILSSNRKSRAFHSKRKSG